MGENDYFADTSKVCKSATYSGRAKEYESFKYIFYVRFKIKVRRIDGFAPKAGMKHKISLTSNKGINPSKGFIFDKKTEE
jgi:hypothetical protein